MKAVVVVKLKGGYIAFPFEQPVTLSNVEDAVPVDPDAYSKEKEIGESVLGVFRELEEKGGPA